MKKKNQNEELQTRREFFKKAARKALPILGAVILTSAPAVVSAAEKAPMGCTGTCTGFCYGGCKGCSTTCTGTCKYACRGCETTCTGGCKHYACKGVGKN